MNTINIYDTTDPQPAEGTPIATNNRQAEHKSEFMRLYFRSLRSYKALTSDDEVDEKVINILGPFSENSPDPSSPPISITDVKDFTIDMFGVEDLIDNVDYHHHLHKTVMLLHRFMTAHHVDFFG